MQVGHLTNSLEGRLEAVRERVREAADRARRDPDAVTLVAVTKGVPLERILACAALGVTDFGESRVQEALPKIAAADAGPGLRWHLVGHLQRNKARRAAEVFSLIHSVDSVPLAETLARSGEARGTGVRVLLQVNVAGVPGQHGFAPPDVTAAARRLARLPGLSLEGVMTIAPLVPDPEAVRPVFAALRRLGEAAREEIPGARHLSMGMSDDFEVAVEEGATLIRVGRAIFGERA